MPLGGAIGPAQGCPPASRKPMPATGRDRQPGSRPAPATFMYNATRWITARGERRPTAFAPEDRL
jgi:hypothetical protein